MLEVMAGAGGFAQDQVAGAIHLIARAITVTGLADLG